jgi:tetratricopeptide (TPR) repeat protein
VGPGFVPQGASTGGDPDPKVLPGSNQSGSDRGMVVDVRPSQNGGITSGSQPAEDRGARIDTLIRVAREQQVIGSFAKAADAYEKALELGASPASTNQRLAQCYEKLGKKADAIKAYERAITAFERLDQNDVRVQAQLESCRQALKLLRGN